MAKNMTIQEVLDAIETQDFNNLIGTVEGEALDFKGAPYQLNSMRET